MLVLIAAILLPLEIGLRRLRLTPGDLVAWVRHPYRLNLSLPRWAPDLPTQTPTWVPGAAKSRAPTPPIVWPKRSTEARVGGHASPGLARGDATTTATEDDDALGEAMRWLAARRGSSGDRG